MAAKSPDTIAGPSARAGFTEAPLNGIPTAWIASRVSGITMIAWPASRRVTVRMTATKIAVRTTSVRNAPPSLTPGMFLVPATTDWLDRARITAEPATAPITWAIT